jgi:hypothetical protein
MDPRPAPRQPGEDDEEAGGLGPDEWLKAELSTAAARGDCAEVDRLNKELRARTTSAAKIDTYSAAEIFAPLDPLDWTVEGLGIAPGPVTAFAGRGEAGKTLSLQSLELAVATGSKIWGEYHADEGPVTHVDFEQGRYLTFLRFQRLGNALGCDVDALEARDLIRCAVYPETKLTPESEPSWRQLCEGRRLVVIDSFRAACPKIDENSSEAREPLDMLGAISDTTGCTIVVLLHGRKSQLGDPGGARDSVRGSSAIHDAVQSGFVLQQEQKGGPTVVTHIKSRLDGHKRDPFGLRIVDVPNGGNDRWGVSVDVEDLGELKKRAAQKAQAELLDKVVQYVRGKPDCTTAMIRERVGKRHGTVCALLDELEGDALVKNLGTTSRPKWRAI